MVGVAPERGLGGGAARVDGAGTGMAAGVEVEARGEASAEISIGNQS